MTNDEIHSTPNIGTYSRSTYLVLDSEWRDECIDLQWCMCVLLLCLCTLQFFEVMFRFKTSGVVFGGKLSYRGQK